MWNAFVSVALLAALLVPTPCEAAGQAARKLSGAQIRAKFTGMQFTDEVHWRDVYERDGTLRSYSMGRKLRGRWAVEADDLCLDLPEPDGGCYEVATSARGIVLTPRGPGLQLEGVLQPISDP